MDESHDASRQKLLRIVQRVVEEERVRLRSLVQEGLAVYRPILVAKVHSLVQNYSRSDAIQTEWVAIRTLYQFRQKVGGRFSILRELWVGAGFPLTNKHGEVEKHEDYDNKGWDTLVQWLHGKEFEVRRASGSDVQFEIASTKRSKI